MCRRFRSQDDLGDWFTDLRPTASSSLCPAQQSGFPAPTAAGKSGNYSPP